MASRTEGLAAHVNLDPLELADTTAVKFRRFLQLLAVALFPPRVVLFLVFFALYLYTVVDLRLVFQARDKLFLWNLDFFTDFLGQPGSLLKWVDDLLVQLCYNGWPGAIAMAAIAWLLLVSTIGFMNAAGRVEIGGMWVIPAILLMIPYSNYFFQTQVIVGLALAMAAANGWCRLPVRRPGYRLFLFIILSVAVYYVTGVTYYCFAACCVIHEALAEKRWLWGAFFLLAAAGVKFGLDVALLQFDLASQHFHILSLEDNSLLNWWVMLLYGYFPLGELYAVFRQPVYASMKRALQRLRGPKKNIPSEHIKPTKQNKGVHPERTVSRPGILRRFRWAVILRLLRWVVGTVAVLSLAAAAGFYSLNRDLKAYLEIDYCAEHQLWNELLTKVEKLPPQFYLNYINHDVNLALYHTDQLPYRMFSYPQISLPLLCREQISSAVLMRKPCNLLLELGRTNEAEQLALETLEMWPSGGSLKRLALIKMIKGQPAAARVFLNVLRDDLVWGRWAEGYLQRLDTDPDLTNDEEIRQMRERMIVKDDIHLIHTISTDEKLSSVPLVHVLLMKLLEKNGRNRMAFEYLLSIYLKAGYLQEVIDSLSYLDNFSYPAIPKLYEEAILIYAGRHPEVVMVKDAEVFFRGRKISESTMNEFHRYQEIAKQYGELDGNAKSAMAHELGDSYFYYFICTLGRSP
jgi:hypothetical protein